MITPLPPKKRNICTPMFIAALFTTVENWKQPRFYYQMTKQNVIYTYNEKLFGLKKEIIALSITWVSLEETMLSEISWTDKEKNIMILLICSF